MWQRQAAIHCTRRRTLQPGEWDLSDREGRTAAAAVEAVEENNAKIIVIIVNTYLKCFNYFSPGTWHAVFAGISRTSGWRCSNSTITRASSGLQSVFCVFIIINFLSSSLLSFRFPYTAASIIPFPRVADDVLNRKSNS